MVYQLYCTLGIIWTYQWFRNFLFRSIFCGFLTWLIPKRLWMTNITFAIKQRATPHKSRGTVLLSHRLNRSFDSKSSTVSLKRTTTRCSVLDTLSMLHYCGSCSKQCNNERASISRVPRRPVVIHPIRAFEQGVTLQLWHMLTTASSPTSSYNQDPSVNKCCFKPVVLTRFLLCLLLEEEKFPDNS